MSHRQPMRIEPQPSGREGGGNDGSASISFALGLIWFVWFGIERQSGETDLVEYILPAYMPGPAVPIKPNAQLDRTPVFSVIPGPHASDARRSDR